MWPKVLEKVNNYFVFAQNCCQENTLTHQLRKCVEHGGEGGGQGALKHLLCAAWIDTEVTATLFAEVCNFPFRTQCVSDISRSLTSKIQCSTHQPSCGSFSCAPNPHFVWEYSWVRAFWWSFHLFELEAWNTSFVPFLPSLSAGSCLAWLPKAGLRWQSMPHSPLTFGYFPFPLLTRRNFWALGPNQLHWQGLGFEISILNREQFCQCCCSAPGTEDTAKAQISLLPVTWGCRQALQPVETNTLV